MKYLLVVLVASCWLVTAVSRPISAQSGYPGPGTPPGYPGPITSTPQPTNTPMPTVQLTPQPTAEIPSSVGVTAVGADAGFGPLAAVLIAAALVIPFLYIWRSR